MSASSAAVHDLLSGCPSTSDSGGPGGTAGHWDAFVARFDPRRCGADQLVYATFLGGTGFDYGFHIVLDDANSSISIENHQSTGITVNADDIAREHGPHITQRAACGAGGVNRHTMRDYPLLLLGFAFAALGGEVFVRGAMNFAQALRVPAVIVASTIAAFVTSSPELAVAIA